MFSWLKRKNKTVRNEMQFIATAKVEIPFDVAPQYPMERIKDMLALEIGRRIINDKNIKFCIDDIKLKTTYSVEAKFIGEGGIE